MKKIFPVFLFLISCVDVNIENNSHRGNLIIPYKELDGGGFSHETAHFKISGYSFEIIEKYADIAEQLYTTIMNDTGLYSFVPQNPYKIVIYKDKEEFIRKTSSPDWSGGITYGNAILLYEQERYPAVIAHEMTHLIFNEFMEDFGANNYIWLNEGLAVYEERKAWSQSNFYYQKLMDEEVRKFPLSFLQMTSYKPLENTPNVEKWYAQCTWVVEYLLKTGGSFRFYIFLKNLRSGQDIDMALKQAYPGIWHDFADLEKKWQSLL